VFGKVNNNEDSKEMQDDLNTLFNWSQDWQIAFNIDKCKVMHIGRRNLQSKYFMNNMELEKIQEEKDLGIYVTDDLKWSKQCLYVYIKANRTLGMISKTICTRDKRMILNMYKTLV